MYLDWLALAFGAVSAVAAGACIAAAIRGRRLSVVVRVLLGLLALPLSAYAFNGLGIGLGLSGH